MDVEAGDVGEEAFEPAPGVDESEVVADFGVSDVPPEADARRGELAHEALAFEFGGDGFPGGEVFEGEADAGFGEDGCEVGEGVAEGVEEAGGLFVAEELGAEFEALVFGGELAAGADEVEEVVGEAGHVEVAGMADDGGGADFGGEAEGAGDVLDGGGALGGVEGGGGVEFGVGAEGADGDGAEVVDGLDADFVGLDFGEDAGDEFGAEVVAEFDGGEAQGEDFVDHGLAGNVASGVPAGGEG